MTPVDQGRNEDCVSACLASLLELPLDRVPNFMDGVRSPEEFWNRVYAFLASRGERMVMIPTFQVPFNTYYLASGRSSRGSDHMVVACNNAVAHDPHPSRAGVESFKNAWIIRKLNETVARFYADEAATVQREDATAYWLFSGPSPWDLRDRSRLIRLVGSRVCVGGAGGDEVYEIAAVETFARWNGPDVGEALGLLARTPT